MSVKCPYSQVYRDGVADAPTWGEPLTPLPPYCKPKNGIFLSIHIITLYSLSKFSSTNIIGIPTITSSLGTISHKKPTASAIYPISVLIAKTTASGIGGKATQPNNISKSDNIKFNKPFIIKNHHPQNAYQRNYGNARQKQLQVKPPYLYEHNQTPYPLEHQLLNHSVAQTILHAP